MAKIKIAIEERRVSKTGDSLYVTLPFRWASEQGLKPKDAIKIAYGNVLVVIPKGLQMDKDALTGEMSLLIEAGLIHEKALKEKKRR